MEFHQAIQNRAGQTIAVVNKYLPTLTVGGITAAGLLAQSQALDPLPPARDFTSETNMSRELTPPKCFPNLRAR
jgi:hypothetical protein